MIYLRVPRTCYLRPAHAHTRDTRTYHVCTYISTSSNTIESAHACAVTMEGEQGWGIECTLFRWWFGAKSWRFSPRSSPRLDRCCGSSVRLSRNSTRARRRGERILQTEPIGERSELLDPANRLTDWPSRLDRFFFFWTFIIYLFPEWRLWSLW